MSLKLLAIILMYLTSRDVLAASNQLQHLLVHLDVVAMDQSILLLKICQSLLYLCLKEIWLYGVDDLN